VKRKGERKWGGNALIKRTIKVLSRGGGEKGAREETVGKNKKNSHQKTKAEKNGSHKRENEKRAEGKVSRSVPGKKRTETEKDGATSAENSQPCNDRGNNLALGALDFGSEDA